MIGCGGGARRGKGEGTWAAKDVGPYLLVVCTFPALLEGGVVGHPETACEIQVH